MADDQASQCSLRGIVVEGDPGIVDEEGQTVPLLQKAFEHLRRGGRKTPARPFGSGGRLHLGEEGQDGCPAGNARMSRMAWVSRNRRPIRRIQSPAQEESSGCLTVDFKKSRRTPGSEPPSGDPGGDVHGAPPGPPILGIPARISCRRGPP